MLGYSRNFFEWRWRLEVVFVGSRRKFIRENAIDKVIRAELKLVYVSMIRHYRSQLDPYLYELYSLEFEEHLFIPTSF